MPCGAIVYFDRETEAAIRGLWQVIEDAGLPSTMPSQDYPPHMTLMVCEDMALDQLRSRLGHFLWEHPPMPVDFDGLGVFHSSQNPLSMIYQHIVASMQLLELHQQFCELASPFIQGQSDYYRPGLWVPHITLDREVPLDQTGAVIDALLRLDLPKGGLLKELVLADFHTGEPGLTEMFKARLGSYL